MPKTLKVGIVGCGGIANRKHLPCLSRLDTVEIVAFCDIIEERAQKAAKEYGDKKSLVSLDYRDLLKDRSIDVIHVCTPNDMHAEIAIASLEAGKHTMS